MAALPDSEPVTKVSIIPRGGTLGVTVFEPSEELFNHSKEYYETSLSILLGGRAAEMLVFNSMTTGASDDLKRATATARQMVAMWGMGEKLPHIALGEADRDVFLGEQLSHQRSYSEETARKLDEEVISLLRSAYDRTTTVLTKNRDALETLAKMLLEKEQVTGDDVRSILSGKSPEDYDRSNAAPIDASPDSGSPQESTADPRTDDNRKDEDKKDT